LVFVLTLKICITPVQTHVVEILTRMGNKEAPAEEVYT